MRRITELTYAGIILTGIARILDLEGQNSTLQADNAMLRQEADSLTADSANH